MAGQMELLAAEQEGYLGFESVHEAGRGISVSFWRDEACAAAFRAVAEHRVAQRLGHERWYRYYRVTVAEVLRDYTGGSVGAVAGPADPHQS